MILSARGTHQELSIGVDSETGFCLFDWFPISHLLNEPITEHSSPLKCVTRPFCWLNCRKKLQQAYRLWAGTELGRCVLACVTVKVFVGNRQTWEIFRESRKKYFWEVWDFWGNVFLNFETIFQIIGRTFFLHMVLIKLHLLGLSPP